MASSGTIIEVENPATLRRRTPLGYSGLKLPPSNKPSAYMMPSLAKNIRNGAIEAVVFDIGGSRQAVSFPIELFGTPMKRCAVNPVPAGVRLTCSRDPEAVGVRGLLDDLNRQERMIVP